MSNIDIQIAAGFTFGSVGVGNGQFSFPTGITILNDEIFVCDKQNNRIQKFDLDGNYLAQFGSVGAGNDNFFFPEGIANDGTNLFVVDGANHRIKKHQPDGTYLTEFGSVGTGNDNFKYPVGIDIDIDNSVIYIADKQNNRIKKHDLVTGGFISEFGTYGVGNQNLNFPEGVIRFDNSLIVADSANKKVKFFNLSGVFISEISTKIFSYPTGLFNIENAIFGVIDRTGNETIYFDSIGTLLTEFGSNGSGTENFSFPLDGFYQDNKIFITDSGNNRINSLNSIIELSVPVYAQEITKTTKTFYPTGRAWWLTFKNIFYKLHEALSFSESRALENSDENLNAILPDNDGFSETDAYNWEKALGLYIQTNLTLDERKQAITRKMQYPGLIKARQHYLYLQGQLQNAGFDVYVHENRFETATPGVYEIFNPVGSKYGQVKYNNAKYGFGSITDYTKIANYIEETKDAGFNFGDDINLRETFFLGGPNFGDRAIVNPLREKEFRELILKIKPAQTAGFLLIDYSSFNPIELNPYVWLDSSVGVNYSDVLGVDYVDSWEDQSGFGYDVSQLTGVRRPKLITDNGINALQFGFGGSAQWLDMVNELNFTNYEMFMVYKATDISTLLANYILTASVGRNSSALKYAYATGGTGVTGYGAVVLSPALKRLRTNSKPLNEIVISSITEDQIFKNNIEESYSFQDTITGLFIDRIGARQDLSSIDITMFIGNLYEIIVVPKLSVEDRTKLFNYLENKYSAIL